MITLYRGDTLLLDSFDDGIRVRAIADIITQTDNVLNNCNFHDGLNRLKYQAINWGPKKI
jgi:hypothetical protein